MKIWIKMYPEMLHDRKIRKLSERDQLVWMKLLLLAGQEDKNGYLPPLDDIAMELYMKAVDIDKSLRTLIEAGLLTETLDGDTLITNFAKRQETNLTSAEKVRRYRETHKVVTEPGYMCNQKVTVDIDKESEIDKEKESEVEVDTSVTGLSEIADFWIPVFGKEAYRAKAFSDESGIRPMANEYKRWNVELIQFSQADIGIEQMVEAIRKIRKENKITIGTPGSVFRVARDLAAKKVKPQAKKVDYLAELTWEGCNE